MDSVPNGILKEMMQRKHLFCANFLAELCNDVES